jgi:chemotaxis protein methyltransferase CheR
MPRLNNPNPKLSTQFLNKMNETSKMVATDFKNDYFKIQMADEDFHRLSTFIYNELGIKMPIVKKVMLQSRLQKRLSELKISSFKEYVDFVFSREGQEQEMIKMIDLVTTNKTDFFREPTHFDFLKETALPEIVSENKDTGTIKIWSAGCSSGEEPYTLAIVLAEFMSKHPRMDYEIFATDLSTKILESAMKAIYHEDRVKNIPFETKKKFFLKSSDPSNKTVRVIPELRSKVSFRRINFMDSQYAVDKSFDIVFCRNVLIYFDMETQQQVITKLSSRLKTNGFFFLGHSESITNMKVPLRQIKPTIFRKI